MPSGQTLHIDQRGVLSSQSSRLCGPHPSRTGRTPTLPRPDHAMSLLPPQPQQSTSQPFKQASTSNYSTIQTRRLLHLNQVYTQPDSSGTSAHEHGTTHSSPFSKAKKWRSSRLRLGAQRNNIRDTYRHTSSPHHIKSPSHTNLDASQTLPSNVFSRGLLTVPQLTTSLRIIRPATPPPP